MNTKTETPIPPGGTGLPLVGETLAYLANGYEFIERRRAQFGPVFRTNILGRPTAVISWPDACAERIDPEKIQRDGSMPPQNLEYNWRLTPPEPKDGLRLRLRRC